VVPPSIRKHGGDITSIVASARAAASTPDYAGRDSASRNIPSRARSAIPSFDGRARWHLYEVFFCHPRAWRVSRPKRPAADHDSPTTRRSRRAPVATASGA
jgi:hypothetical protein